MAGGAECSAAIWRAGAAQGEAAAGKQACPQERASGLASAAWQRLGATLGWALRGGGRAGAGGPQTGRPALRRARGTGPLWGAWLCAQAKESPGRWLGGQGHLQASRAAPSESLNAALRRRAPAIWRCWEPRHPRLCPSPGGAPALARGRGRAISGLSGGRGAPQRLWSGAQGTHPLPPAMLAVATVQWRLFLPAPPRLGAPSAGRGGRGVARGRSGALQGPGSGSQPSSAEPSLAEARNPLAASAQPSAPLLRAAANVPPSRLPASPEAAAPPTAARVTPKRSRPLTSNLRLPPLAAPVAPPSLAGCIVAVSLRFHCG